MLRFARTALTPLLAGGAVALLGAAAHAQNDWPQRSDDGKTLVVPADQAAKGTVYYAIPGKPVPNADQTRFTNTPPNSKKAKPVDSFTGFSNEIVGYVVTSTGDPQNIIAGEFLLPVDSLDTGIKLRNKHLGTKQWLYKKKNPEIRFSLQGVRDLTSNGSRNGADTYTGEIFGRLTLRGETRDFSFPATIAVRPQNGMIAIRTQYPVTLKDFGVDNGIIGKKVAEQIHVEQFLILSTNKPS